MSKVGSECGKIYEKKNILIVDGGRTVLRLTSCRHFRRFGEEFMSSIVFHSLRLDGPFYCLQAQLSYRSEEKSILLVKTKKSVVSQLKTIINYSRLEILLVDD